jgi:alkylated DNA repair protein alkB family protein 1
MLVTISLHIAGLHIVPSLIPKEAQRALLSKLLHRDLADQRHKTNVHLHHQLPYHAAQKPESLSPEREPEFPTISFFNVSPTPSEHFRPVDTALHKSLTISQFLKRKLRWVTLGGQYDWTRKCYPDENPIFPTDIAAFIHGLFPEMIPEAAIVNVYTPGDTLSVHRDVSEESEKGLVSISLGCDAIFVVGRGSKDDGDAKSLSVRLRSGDAVFMKGPARFAWHGVPQIISGSCPEWLRDWPADPHVGEVDDACNSTYEAWRDWMSNKRINLNVRQMRD